MKLFHRGYFIEQLRQIRTAGIVATAVFSAITIATFFVRIAMETAGIPNGSFLAMPMLLFVFIVGLVLTFSSYGWMNHRKTSDFYHALPIKRSAMFGSTTAAIFLWMAVGLTAHILLQMLLNLIFRMPFNYLLLLAVWGNMLIAALQMIGAASIACAISGSRFVNIFGTLFILFVPRLLMIVLAAFVSGQSISFRYVMRMSPFFDPSFNLLGMPYMSFGGLFGEDFVSLTNIWASLYGIVYSAVLLMLGCLAFVKRQSEMAVIAIKNPIYQGAIRTAVGLPLLLVVVAMWKSDAAEIPWAIYGILILFSFIFYCLYELISTRRIKKVLIAMPFYAICIGIALLYLVVPDQIANGINAQTAEASEIRGVRIVNADLENSYQAQQASKVLIEDPKVIEIVSDAYNRSLTTERVFIELNELYDVNSGRSMELTIVKKNGTQMERRLPFTDEELEQIEKAMLENETISGILAEYPRGAHYYSANRLTRTEAEEIGRLFEQEYCENPKTIEPAAYASDYRLQLTVTGTYWTENYVNVYNITASTPKTAQRYLELLNAKSESLFRKGMQSILQQLDKGMTTAPHFRIMINGDLYFSGWDMQYKVVGDGEELYSKASDPNFYEILSILANAELATDMETCAVVSFDDLIDETEFENMGLTLKDLFGSYSYQSQGLIGLKLTQSDLAKIEALLIGANELRVERIA